MIGSIEILCENPSLHELLLSYRQQRKQRRDAEWDDRIMRFDDLSDKELSKLHGTLLALGWLETRVCREAFDVPGQLTACYRVTHEGIRALNYYERTLGMNPSDIYEEELIAEEVEAA